MSFIADNDAYEDWLRNQCAVVEADLEKKHKRMKLDPFVFLRATYFRRAKKIEALPGSLADGLAVPLHGAALDQQLTRAGDRRAPLERRPDPRPDGRLTARDRRADGSAGGPPAARFQAQSPLIGTAKIRSLMRRLRLLRPSTQTLL